MSKAKVQYRKKLAAIFVSLTILGVGTLSLFQSRAIDYYSVLSTLLKVVPASFVMGGLGWVMGMILDQPKRRSRGNYGASFVNNLLKTSIHEVDGGGSESAESSKSEATPIE